METKTARPNLEQDLKEILAWLESGCIKLMEDFRDVESSSQSPTQEVGDFHGTA